MIFQKLVQPARFLLDEEELLIWALFRAERMVSFLRGQATAFDVSELIQATQMVDQHLSWDDEHLFSPDVSGHSFMFVNSPAEVTFMSMSLISRGPAMTALRWDLGKRLSVGSFRAGTK